MMDKASRDRRGGAAPYCGPAETRAILVPCGKASPPTTGAAMGMLDGKVAFITGTGRS